MSKQKPTAKGKRPTHGELYLERVFGPWMRTSTAKANPREILATLEKQRSERAARWDEETHGPRSVPDDCNRPVVLAIRQAAKFLHVDGKSDRFIARFIATGVLAANKEARQRWKFDEDELKRLRAKSLCGEL